MNVDAVTKCFTTGLTFASTHAQCLRCMPYKKAMSLACPCRQGTEQELDADNESLISPPKIGLRQFFEELFGGVHHR